MRIAVLADIHGNLFALEAVLKDLAEAAPDLVVNLGDCLSGPLQARETADLLMQRNWPTVRGNHDRQLVDRAPEAMGPSDRAAFDQLDERQLAWLEALPTTLRIDGELLACHGTPEADDVFLAEEIVGPATLMSDGRSIERRAGGAMATLILCGHSHVPRWLRLPSGRGVLNPGSVGLQAYQDDDPHPYRVAVGSPHARYALIDRSADGWTLTQRALDYDWDAAAQIAQAAGRRDWAEALATGWLTA